MSFSHYNKETGLITHFDGDGKYAVRDFFFFLGFVCLSMIFAVIDEIFGPYNLPLILKFVKVVGNIGFECLFLVIELVWNWWLDIAG